jgi:hypothetical protein
MGTADMQSIASNKTPAKPAAVTKPKVKKISKPVETPGEKTEGVVRRIIWED